MLPPNESLYPRTEAKLPDFPDLNNTAHKKFKDFLTEFSLPEAHLQCSE
jgi:hypothetical protein